MTEHKDDDQVKLSCSVSTYGRCRYTVKWVYEGNDQDVNTDHMKSSCSAAVTFITSHLSETSKYSELFKCNVTDIYTGEVKLFTFSPSSSGEKSASFSFSFLSVDGYYGVFSHHSLLRFWDFICLSEDAKSTILTPAVYE